MKWLYLILLLFLKIETVEAQIDTATQHDHSADYSNLSSEVFNTLSWVKTSCKSNKEVNLYRELDSGYIIIHEYVMMNCRPCITAGKGLEKLVASLKQLYPNQIKYFQTVYDSTTSCSEIKLWVKQNNFHPDDYFVNGDVEVDFYGGMGMPTIIVLAGGKRHKGYYKKLGFSPRDNARIIKAVRKAIQVMPSKSQLTR